MSDRSNRVPDIVLTVVFCVLFAVGSFCDRDISLALYTPGSIPNLIISTVGQYTFFSAFVFFAGVLARQAAVCETITEKRRLLYKILCGYLALSTAVIGSTAELHYECIGAFFPGLDFSLLFIFLFALIFMYPLFFLGYAVGPRSFDKTLVTRLIKILIYIAVGASLVGGLKEVIFRPRFRVTLAGYEDITFTPWYMPLNNARELIEKYGFNKNELQSLPSGHSLMGIAHIYIFPALSWVFPKLNDKGKLLWVMGLIYGLAVIASRLFLGAHHLSDVSAGALLSILLGIFILKTPAKADRFIGKPKDQAI